MQLLEQKDDTFFILTSLNPMTKIKLKLKQRKTKIEKLNEELRNYTDFHKNYIIYSHNFFALIVFVSLCESTPLVLLSVFKLEANLTAKQNRANYVQIESCKQNRTNRIVRNRIVQIESCKQNRANRIVRDQLKGQIEFLMHFGLHSPWQLLVSVFEEHLWMPFIFEDFFSCYCRQVGVDYDGKRINDQKVLLQIQ